MKKRIFTGVVLLLLTAVLAERIITTNENGAEE